MKKIVLSLIAISFSGACLAQENVVPYVVTGATSTGLITSPIGTGSGGSVSLPVTGSVVVTPGAGAVTPTDRGGTITTGGTAQNAMASNASRKGGWVQNPCTATESLFLSTSTTATTTGVGDDVELPPCGSYSLNQNGLIIQSAVSVIAATTGHRWLAKETQ